MMDLIKLYSFQIVVIGTILLAITSALVGTLNVYKNQALIGDALGHSTLPGIVLAFMLTSQRNPLTLLLGVMVTAALSYYLIEYSNKNSNIEPDANMAIYLSGFFGLGLVLKSFIQGNPSYANASKAGLDKYIFGQAAYLQENDITLIFIVFIICLGIIIFFYRDMKCYLFDSEFAKLIGVNTKRIDHLILFMTILVIGVGIKAVGVILISSLLIIPIITASKLSNNLLGVLGISALLSAIASITGSAISTLYQGFSTGPTIIIIQGLIALLVILAQKLSKGGHKI
ncbi:metal ABC transporter permease [uncultured Anaerococcus sp.]|uniref:metal ABC transporter permease n=1 Tax=uncultured Anaerococcus sp. TaxID=293428 RepID=UPI0025E3B94F|nr:metal ABC transporter permease [uncultured Anaerococcus sp.]